MPDMTKQKKQKLLEESELQKQQEFSSNTLLL
jgi:hypothetical protein